MSMSEHTPGPWRVVQGGRRIHGATIRSDEDGGIYIASLSSERDDMEANARLIAAAPDLLEALERSLTWLSSYPGEGALLVYDQARAAIEKATKEVEE